jgi:hypothetical protein
MSQIMTMGRYSFLLLTHSLCRCGTPNDQRLLIPLPGNMSDWVYAEHAAASKENITAWNVMGGSRRRDDRSFLRPVPSGGISSHGNGMHPVTENRCQEPLPEQELSHPRHVAQCFECARYWSAREVHGESLYGAADVMVLSAYTH